jgi:hypothetical protein
MSAWRRLFWLAVAAAAYLLGYDAGHKKGAGW